MSRLTRADPVLDARLRVWATDTWASFVAMTEPTTGLPADWLGADGSRASFTSPTNIGMYLWAIVGARDIGLISSAEARARVAVTLATLERLERSQGFFYNWYDPATGERLLQWSDGDPVHGFLSTVDNAWLAAALMVVAAAVPQLHRLPT